MTSVYTISRQDLYDFQRCPKIVAIKSDRALRAIRERDVTPARPPGIPRFLEPAIIGSIGEAAVRLGFSGIPTPAAMRQIESRIPQVNVNSFLKQIAIDSLSGVENVKRKLAKEFGQITIVGRGEGRTPDLAGIVHPDFIAFSKQSEEPIIVETKDTTRQNPTDRFQAMFYNGVAEKYGVYLLEQRVEDGKAMFSPKTVRSKAQTILIYPRLSQYSAVDEVFVADQEMIRGVWEAKQLGLKGLSPATKCSKKCPHHRLKADLPEGSIEPLPPPPLLFSQGMIDAGYDLDGHYQTSYAWKLLPVEARLAIILRRLSDNATSALKDWLISTAGLDEETAEIIVHADKREKVLSSKPDAEKLLKQLKGELEPWREILKTRLTTSAPSILGRATAVYSLPSGSRSFVKDAYARWK